MAYEDRTILKLYRVVRMGYTNYRRFQPYTPEIARFGNCYFDSVYSLTNGQIKLSGLDLKDRKSFKNFSSFSKESCVDDMRYFARQTGLRIEECDYSAQLDILERKIALYFEEDSLDFHCLREEKTKTGQTIWLGKCGFSPEVQKKRELKTDMGGMKLYGCYKVTNPNLEK